MRLLVLALLIGVYLAPSAVADHVYSHRYVFEGRLIDGNGLPVPAAEVEFFAEGDTFNESCGEPQQSITDEWGDFRFCFHKHELKVSTVVGVRVGDIETHRPMDTAFRRTIVLLRDENATGVAPPGWEETYRVAGKVWRPGSADLEGVQVYGVAVANRPVSVTFRADDDNETTLDVMTDRYGDFNAVIQLAEGIDPANVTVIVQSEGATQRAPLSTSWHRNTIGVTAIPTRSVVSANFPEPAPAAPGRTSPGISPLLIVGGAIAVVATLAVKHHKDRKKE